ncbi:MAG: biotin--[acetyl-CoA-carboxylase] ligase [Gemmatimonadales bacterium]|nr:MAG: biotin--[acetyl-CoA-carboxylase] ligase [Gemmatimonadales bacterium]
MKIPGAGRVEVHGRIASTNLRARELVAGGAQPFTVVVAREQFRGRGRSGRDWYSPTGGGLWMSVVLPAPVDGPHGRVSILLGIAAAEAVEAVTGVAVGLKWPNDLLLIPPHAGGDAGKVAGILCEVAPVPPSGERASGAGEAAPPPLLVAGFGVNLRAFPPGTRPPGAVGLEEVAGHPVDREALATALVASLRRWTNPPAAGALPPAALSAWTRRDVLFGHPVVTSTGVEGIARGVDPHGALRIQVQGGAIMAVTSGSVRRRGAGSPALFRGTHVTVESRS